jgi:hypothetical protein
VLFNNVLFNENSGHGDLLIDSSSLAGFKSDYNVLAGREDVGDGSSFESLAAWRTQTGQDTHSIQSTEAAVFINSAGANYQLAATSPALNAGISSFNGYLPPITDLLGSPRPAGGAFDIGAYETQSTGAAPTFTLSGAATATVGSSYTLTLTSSAATNDAMTSWLVKWGDGTTQTVTAGAEAQVNGKWVTTATATHVYSTAATETISATATDTTGTNPAGNTVAVQVNAPVVTPPTLSLSGAATVNVGSNYVLTLTSSAATNDAMTSWLVTWGDGTHRP